VRKVCTLKLSVGADGVIFVEDSDQADFRWDFYNADGSSAEMCGNGGRCVARYALARNIAAEKMSFETTAGIITAEVKDNHVRICLTASVDLRQDIKIDLNGKTYAVDSLNTGVPHAIVFSDNVAEEDVCELGRGIRNHKVFSPAGTNVDFVQRQGDGSLRVRTYERGVERETLACGTGVVASVLLASQRNLVSPPVKVQTQGGEVLTVDFSMANGTFGEVFLEGPVKTVFEGTIVEL
jgi:diaminopimelate epimerase